jgi:3-oxoacyl-[acyl-carrier protein] reductase
VVTGASRGIGLAIARRLACAGHDVVAVARSAGAPLESAIAEAKKRGNGSLHFQQADLSEIEALPALARLLRRKSGPIEALVNNAGTGNAGLLATMQDGEIERMLRLNLLSPIILTRHVARGMMADGGGRIVNVSSIVGFAGFKGMAAYAASKAGLIGFTRALAREFGPLGITVNAIAPGFVDTDLTRSMGEADRAQVTRRSALRRLAEPCDVAAAVDYLLGEGARNVTGTVLTVDAGATA